MEPNINRRQFTKAAAMSSALAGLAGCTGGGSGGGTSGDSGTSGGGTPEPSQAISVGGVTIPSDVVRGTRQEGEIVHYSTMDEPDILEFFKPGFEELFPEVNVRVVALGAGELTSKLLSERRSNNVQADAVADNIGASRALEGTGVYVNYESSHWLKQAAADLGYDEFYYGEKPHEFPGYGVAYTLLYHTEKLSEGEAPDSWEELGNDRWTGDMGIVMQHPAQLSAIGGLFATLYGVWGHDKWVDVVADIVDNNPQLISSNSQSYRVMIQGERALSPNYINDLVAQLAADEDPPAAAKWLEPSLVNFTPTHVVADAPNPNAAEAFVGWYMSEEAQTLVGDTGRTPLLTDVAATHPVQKLVIPEGANLRPEAFNNPTYNGANYLEDPQEWVPLFEEHFGGP